MAELPGGGTIVAGSSQSVRTPVGNVTDTYCLGKVRQDRGSLIHSFIQLAFVGLANAHTIIMGYLRIRACPKELTA